MTTKKEVEKISRNKQLVIYIESQEQKIRDNLQFLKDNKKLPQEAIDFREMENERAEAKIKKAKADIKGE